MCCRVIVSIAGVSIQSYCIPECTISKHCYEVEGGGSSSNYKLINQLPVHVKFWGKNEQKLYMDTSEKQVGREVNKYSRGQPIPHRYTGAQHLHSCQIINYAAH